jgi:hypothetical protein
MTRVVALVNSSSRAIAPAALEAVARALQIQVDRDFFPAWGQRAQVLALGPGEAAPKGAWPLTLLDKPQYGLGVHLDQRGRPFAEVEATDDWSVTASHELLEMLEDPLGQKFVSAPDIAPGAPAHRVNYLVEVADPCETFAYSIDGVQVSDFVTRDFYDPAAAGVAVDFLGRLAGPFDVPPGGYLSWIDPADGHWHQKTPDGAFTRSGGRADHTRNPREDRDQAFGGEVQAARHRLASIRGRWAGR